MRYFKVFLRVYSARLGKDFSLPVPSQLLQLSGSLCFFGLHLLAFRFLLSKFHFFGWSQPQSWVLLLTFEIFTYLAFFLFWNGFNKTVRDINTGALDLVISKPISSQFITFFRGGGSHNLIAATLGFLLLALVVTTSNLPVSLLSLIGYLLLLLASLWVFYCLSICFISLNFKYGNLTATPGVMFQVQEVYKYPSTLYSRLPVLAGLLPIGLSLFTTFPAAVLIFTPLPVYFYFIYSAFLISFTFFSRWAWHSGLRQYSSASS